MNDLISRQAAIDALLKCGDWYQGNDEAKRGVSQCIGIVNDLPSAQPEIIRCKDCVNHVDDRCLVANHHTGDIEYCMEVFGAKRKGEQE